MNTVTITKSSVPHFWDIRVNGRLVAQVRGTKKEAEKFAAKYKN